MEASRAILLLLLFTQNGNHKHFIKLQIAVI